MSINRVVAVGLGTVLGMFALGYILTIITRPLETIVKVTDPDKMIQNYEWFHQTYDDVIAAGQKIAQTQGDITEFEKSSGDRDKWTFEDKVEHARLRSVLTGLVNHRASMLAEYNAKSRMLTRGWLKSRGLPEFLQ